MIYFEMEEITEDRYLNKINDVLGKMSYVHRPDNLKYMVNKLNFNCPEDRSDENEPTTDDPELERISEILENMLSIMGGDYTSYIYNYDTNTKQMSASS